MSEYVTAPNAITSANLAAGFTALLLAVDGYVIAAAWLVAFAAVLDACDGLVARRQNTAGRFGGNLDSLADVVSFGVVPAVMLRAGPLAEWPLLGAVTGLAFVLAGAWRLARFPLVADRPHWVGLPIPAAGLVAAATAALGPPLLVVVAITVVLAVLMVSSLPFPTLPTVGSSLRRKPAAAARGRAQLRPRRPIRAALSPESRRARARAAAALVASGASGAGHDIDAPVRQADRARSRPRTTPRV